MNKLKFSSWPNFSKKESQIISQVLLSNKVNYWTGNIGRDFEKKFAEFSETNFAIALNNGTVAIDLALYALDIGVGDEVIVTPRSFMASVSAIVNSGAKPIFADVDLNSQNITPETVEPLITKKTKAILCVHLAGYPCDMDQFKNLANSYNLFIIEDCAQAHGAKYKGNSIGSLSDVAAWSFCQDKIMTTGGEGGMVTCNKEEYWSKMWSYKDHGKNYDAVYNQKHPAGFRWVHHRFGTNARLTEIQSAIGIYQLGKMNKWHKIRLKNANHIWDCASEIDGLNTPFIPDHIEHGAYKCCLTIDPKMFKSNWSRDRLIHEINFSGVPCFVGGCSEIYKEKAFDDSGLRPKKDLKNAKLLGEINLMFLVHPTLLEKHIEKTSNVLKKTVQKAKK